MREDSSVGIATCYGMYGPWIESRWRRDFPHLSRPAALGPTQRPVQWLLGLSRGKAALTSPPPPRSVVKDRVEQYLYSPSGPSWPALGRGLPLLLIETVHSAPVTFLTFKIM